MTLVMGIDGGGSSVRVAVLDDRLAVLGQAQGAAVNPNLVGQSEAAARIQAAMREALAGAGLAAGQIEAVGAGVSGILASGLQGWLRDVAAAVTPQAAIAVCSDYEIALIGAHGRREGLLVLSGTGSLACGINAAGESALVGGWGYLLGDEGSGVWLGLAGLRAAARAADGLEASTRLLDVFLDRLGLAQPRDLVRWLHRPAGIPTAEVAALAPLVLAQAGEGDDAAGRIVAEAAAHLAAAARLVAARLGMDDPRVAFAGSLLTHDNVLSRALCRELELADLPQALYPPVVGAGLLACLTLGIDPHQGE